jgi:hypothetical protein
VEQQWIDFAKHNAIWIYCAITYILCPILFKIIFKIQRYEEGWSYERYVFENKSCWLRFFMFFIFIFSPATILLGAIFAFGLGLGVFSESFFRWMQDMPVNKHTMKKIINDYQLHLNAELQNKIDLHKAKEAERLAKLAEAQAVNSLKSARK